MRTYRVAAEVIADARQLLVCQLDKSQKPPLLPKRLQHRVTGYGHSSYRHPDYPKPPISPYVIFFNQKLAEVRAEHADWNMREIHRYIGDLYRLLPESVSSLSCTAWKCRQNVLERLIALISEYRRPCSRRTKKIKRIFTQQKENFMTIILSCCPYLNGKRFW